MITKLLKLEFVLLAELAPLLGTYSDEGGSLYLGYLAEHKEDADSDKHVFVPIGEEQLQALASRKTSLYAVAEGCSWHLVAEGELTQEGVPSDTQVIRVPGWPAALPAQQSVLPPSVALRLWSWASSDHQRGLDGGSQ